MTSLWRRGNCSFKRLLLPLLPPRVARLLRRCVVMSGLRKTGDSKVSVISQKKSALSVTSKISSEMGIVTDYKPLELCQDNNLQSTFPLIILNQPLEPYGNVVIKLWKKSCYRTMSDGGANRLYNYLQQMNLNVDDYLPDLINGDFDSITHDVKKFYEDRHCEIVQSKDQDNTDFTKSLILVSAAMKQRKINFDYVVALVNTSGRFDHIMGNIQSLYQAKELTDKTVFLLAEKCMTWLLNPGKHRIFVDRTIAEFTCGIIPIGEPCRHITTTGLKWNLNDQELKFGGLISTSNTYDGSDVVTIDTDTQVVWTMEFAH